MILYCEDSKGQTTIYLLFTTFKWVTYLQLYQWVQVNEEVPRKGFDVVVCQRPTYNSIESGLQLMLPSKSVIVLLAMEKKSHMQCDNV